MIEGLIGKKIGMTQTFDPQGNVIPVTIILAGPCTVVQRKTVERDGYEAVQLGFVEAKGVRKPAKATAGHFQKAGVPPTKVLREFRFTSPSGVKEGDQVLVDIFQAGELVKVTGTSKGKGFQGVVTRHGFRGGRATHGSMFHRAPGSIGASSYPSRVLRGTRMGGHMGQDRVTTKNLEVVEADKDNNLLLVRGAVPGPRGGYVLILKRSFAIKTG